MSELDVQAEEAGLIWENNPVLVQLLGLSPVLAVSSTLAYGIGLGIATLAVCLASCLTASALKNYLSVRWRLVCFMLILASYTTLVETIFQLYFYPLSLRLGIYVPLICCNVAILVRMETVAFKSHWLAATLDGLKTGIGFCVALVLLSACRELLISGSLFANWQILLPTTGGAALPELRDAGQFFRFADTQAGVLILLGLLIALINFLRSLLATEKEGRTDSVIPAQRARVTGRLIRDDSKESI